MTTCNVSVVIPNFNRTDLLHRALMSVAKQTLCPLEVIVVDDCSAAEYMTKIKSIIHEFSNFLPLKLIENIENRGANYSRNLAIKYASGKYIAFLDSDDLWMPEKLHKQMRKIEEAKNSDSRPVLSATGRYRVRGDGQLITRQFGGHYLDQVKIKQSNFIGTLSSVVVETWILRHIHGFTEALPACQDWDLFIRLSDYVQFIGVESPLCIYVDHDEDRITLNNKKRLRAHLSMRRMYLRDQDQKKHFGSQLYRNLAEDYQELGNYKKAKEYYIKSLLFTNTKSKTLSSLEAMFWYTYYYFNSIPSIKHRRYDRYRKSMSRAMSNRKFKIQVTNDLALIKGMMETAPTTHAIVKRRNNDRIKTDIS